MIMVVNMGMIAGSMMTMVINDVMVLTDDCHDDRCRDNDFVLIDGYDDDDWRYDDDYGNDWSSKWWLMVTMMVTVMIDGHGNGWCYNDDDYGGDCGYADDD